MSAYKVYFKARKIPGLIDFSCSVEARTKAQAVEFGNREIISMGYRVGDFFKGKASKVVPSSPSGHAGTKESSVTELGTDFSIDGINKLIQKLKPGERLSLEGVPEDIYHATEGYGSTALKIFDKAPAKLAAEKAGLIPHDDSKFVIGSAVHDAVLLPEIFKSNYAVMPPEIKVRRGKAWDEFISQHDGKNILTKDQYDSVLMMRDKILAHYPEYFTQGRAETSYWYHHPSGVILKARTDYETDDLIIDLKTTHDASPDSVQKLIWNLGYYIQRSLYLMVTGLADFVFVFIETAPPHLTFGPVLLDDEATDASMIKCNELIDQISDCEYTRIWGGYPQGIQIVGVPPWIKNRIMH